MSEFWKRTIFGAVFVFIVIASIFVSEITAFIMLAFVLIKSSKEIVSLYPAKVEKALNPSVYSASILLYLFFAAIALFDLPIRYLNASFFIFFVPLLMALFSKSNEYVDILLTSWLSMIYIALPCGLMLLFYNESIIGMENGNWMLVFAFLLIWVNDIFAYLTGSAIGRHKLCERISPKKTIEGSVGGAVFTVLIAYLVNRFVIHFMSDLLILGLALGVVVFGTFGDLCESMMKRRAGVKDSGSIIPGHGGMLDRFDATFLAMPFVFLYLIMI